MYFTSKGQKEYLCEEFLQIRKSEPPQWVHTLQDLSKILQMHVKHVKFVVVPIEHPHQLGLKAQSDVMRKSIASNLYRFHLIILDF